MPPKIFPAGLAILALTAGCDLVSPKSSLSYAASTTGIGPADGPTTIIVLASQPIGCFPPPGPYVTAEIWFPPNPLAGHTFNVNPNGDATAWYAWPPGTHQSASSGSLTITMVDSANTLSGELRAQFPARFVAAHFIAPRIRSNVTCN